MERVSYREKEGQTEFPSRQRGKNERIREEGEIERTTEK